MAAAFDEDDTLESQALTTSLDPYGQLIKMLMPRALCIALYDADGLPLWVSSDTCDSSHLQQLVEEALTGSRTGTLTEEEREGFARSWDGDTSYIFMLRAEARLLGAVAIWCRDASSGSRPFSLVLALLRPALQVLGRELASQSSIEELQRNIVSRESDLELLLDANGTDAGSDDPEQLVDRCVRCLDAAFGTLLIPDKSIEATVPGAGGLPADAAAVVDRTQRHLFAWAQVQRRTLLLNKSPQQGPLADAPYKLLAAPILYQGRTALGVLTLFRPRSGADFDLRQARIVEMMGRRIAYVLQNAYDPTSSLLTRPAFEQRVLALLATANPTSEHCVAYGDIDRLHVVNENHGMHVGDRVIESVAAIMREQLPSDVLAARVSGDRFAFFFPDCPLENAQRAAQAVCHAIEAFEFVHEGTRVQLSMSMGIADVPKTKLPLSHALATAEVACKAAKDRGRNRVEVYQEADCSIVRRYEDVAVIGRIRDALTNDEFRMDAQPLLQLKRGGGGQRRFELLLRMIDPNGESVAPEKFLVAAERYQLATEIDRWVVQYALELLASAAPRLEALGAHFAINISGQSLGDDHFPGFLEGKLREYALPPRLLSFEITETAAVANIVRAEMLIRRLRDLGHGIALDDFGRGLSSLTYLKSLPVTDLKIDGGLVRDLAGNERSQAMVTAIVQLANAMGLTTTAECVESEAIRAAVTRLGVSYGQGFAIGRPRPLESVLQDLLRADPAPRGLSMSLLSRLAG